MTVSRIPVAELPGSADMTSNFAENPIIWDVHTGPYIDDERIFLHAQSLHRAVRIAGFCGVHVRQYVEEETSIQHQTPPMGAPGTDGTATATASLSLHKKPPLAQGNMQPNPDETGLKADYQRPRLLVKIDRHEAGSRISSYVQKGMDREEAWARTYDAALRQGLVRGAIDLNVSLRERHHRYGALWLAFTGSTTVQDAFEKGIPHGAVTYAGLYGIVVACMALDNKLHTNAMGLARRRWSLSPTSTQPDRAALAVALAKTSRFISAGEQ